MTEKVKTRRFSNQDKNQQIFMCASLLRTFQRCRCMSQRSRNPFTFGKTKWNVYVIRNDSEFSLFLNCPNRGKLPRTDVHFSLTVNGRRPDEVGIADESCLHGLAPTYSQSARETDGVYTWGQSWSPFMSIKELWDDSKGFLFSNKLTVSIEMWLKHCKSSTKKRKLFFDSKVS